MYINVRTMSMHSAHAAKSINPRCGSVEINFTVTLSPTSSPFPPRTSMPSTCGLSVRTNVPYLLTPVIAAVPEGRAWVTGVWGLVLLVGLSMRRSRARFHPAF